MNTIEQLVEALKEAKKSIPSTYFVNGNRTEWLIDKAIAAGEAELRREPVGFLFQHSETGRTRVVMRDGVMDADATWFKVGPLYLGEIK
jgi:UDP-2,3-diacylglucosamine pyrophosphatase LpxH